VGGGRIVAGAVPAAVAGAVAAVAADDSFVILPSYM
jgi:hypothetical protein